MSVAKHAMAESDKRANRENATAALRISRVGEAQRQTEEMIGAELERDKIRRKSLMAQGSVRALGAARGTAKSASLDQLLDEFAQREGQYQSAISAKRDQQALAGGMRNAARVSQWQGRMMQNRSSGLAGYALAAGQGYLQSQMIAGKNPLDGADVFGDTSSVTNIPGMGTAPTGSLGVNNQFLYESGAKVYPDGMFP